MRASSTLKMAARRTPGAPATVEVPLPLVGGSDAARRARAALALAAARRTPVLLLAEAGLRPQDLLESLQSRGRRRVPIVAIDSRAAEPADIDERLFGAASRRTNAPDLEALGRGSAILEAGSGTLFLDNIDELPASAQRRLARLLRDGEAHVTARHRTVGLPFRLVASTSRELETDVREGRFRADLLRRFAACRITIPPLRQRPGDLPALVDRLLRETAPPIARSRSRRSPFSLRSRGRTTSTSSPTCSARCWPAPAPSSRRKTCLPRFPSTARSRAGI